MNLSSRYLDYLKSERLMKPRSLNDYRTALNFLSKEIDPLEAKTYPDVNEVIKRIRARRNWSPATTSKNAKCVKNFYAWLTREGIIPHNPFPFHEFKRPRPAEPAYITQDQFDRIMVDPFLTHQELTILLVLWDTAVRVSELCAIDQDEICFKEGYLHVPREKSKGEYSDRYIPFRPETAEALKAQIKIAREYGHEECLFITKWWTRLDPRDVSESLTKIGLRRSPVREAMRLTPHMFRHSFGIRMMASPFNVPETVVQKWLGHASLSMTSHYLHLGKDESLSFYKNLVEKTA